MSMTKRDGCKYCKSHFVKGFMTLNSNSNKTVSTYVVGDQIVTQVKTLSETIILSEDINYCPKCGKKLH